jgi:hypothetical protein
LGESIQAIGQISTDQKSLKHINGCGENFAEPTLTKLQAPFSTELFSYLITTLTPKAPNWSTSAALADPKNLTL